MIYNNAVGGAFDAAQGVVVTRYLCIPGCIGNHELNRIAVPGAIGGVLMVFIRYDKTEIYIIIVPDDLNR